jgi:transposase
MHCPRRAVVHQKNPLRSLAASERRALEQLARSHSAPALSVARARALLAVSDGSSYTEAAQLVGRAVGDSIAQWVARFNQVGLAAVERQAGGRPPTQYGAEERDRILAEFRRRPDRERDGTATWSLNTLQRALRRAPDGLPKVSTYTIWAVLHDAGITWQRDRTWCDTGLAIRKRKRGEVKVQDPDASAKKG